MQRWQSACSSTTICAVYVATARGQLTFTAMDSKEVPPTPGPEVRVLHETPTSIVLDGDGTIGYMPMPRAAKADIVKAKAVGLDIGLVRHIDHYGSAGHYSRMCMEAGCIGFSSQGHHNMGNAGGWEHKPQVGFYGNIRPSALPFRR